MDEKNWQNVKEIFLDALEKTNGERDAFLSEIGDDEIRAEVESLLASHEGIEDFIEEPAFQIGEVFSENGANTAEKQFGNYKILREIGAGGMGAVFLAERADGEFSQKVAIKIIRQTIADRETINRFKRERQILANLNHPNIAKLLDGGVSASGEPFLAMEFIEGETITKFAEARKLNLEERLKLFLKVCAAVSYAHRNLIVHRDLKPGNILVSKDGTPKLLDFGLAKLADENLANDAAQTQTAFRALTPAFASPEQLRGEPLTTASDIYSLGVIFYELLTNERPFDFGNKSLDEVIKTVTESEPPMPSANPKSETPNPKLKGDLDNIALTALRKEPHRRYQSVEAFADDIEKYLKGLPIEARPNTYKYRASKYFKRHKIGVLAVSLILLSLIGGIVVSFWQGQIARQQRDLAQAEREKSDRINKFLQRMLSFSNQSFTSISPIAQGKNVTVNEMLDQITPNIEAELADQPEVRAKILRTIGSSYASQGIYDKAERNFRAALDTQIQIYGEDNTETADTMIELGVLSFRQSNFQESNNLLEKSTHFYRKYQADFPNNSPAKLIQSIDFLAVNKFYSGDTKSCVSLFEEGLKLASESNLEGSEREVIASIKTNFGGAITRMGENEKGEKSLREGLALYSQISDQPRWEVGVARTLLAVNLINRNAIDEAQKELVEGEIILRESLGDNNYYLANNLNQQSILLLEKSEFKAAEKLAQASLIMFDRIYSPGSLFSTRTLVNLGTILTKSGRLKEGETEFKKALRIYEQQATKNFALIIPNKIALGENLLSQNRIAEAEKLALETLSEAQQNLGEQSPITKTAITNLVKIYEKQGKKELAQKYK